MFIIYSGRFRIFLTQPDGTEAPVRDVGQGETLGEIALLTGARRSARVQAVRDSCLLVLPRAVLEQYVERWPRLALSFTRQQIERLHDVQGATVRSSFCEAVAVIPAGGTRDVGRFSRGLAEELLKFEKTALIRPAGRPEEVDDSEERVNTWLEEQEAKNRLLVYEGELSLTSWTARCLRQADTVILVADARADSAPNAIEGELRRIRGGSLSPPRRHLVILRPKGAQPSSGAWLSTRVVDMHHHAEDGDVEDIARVARFVAGRATGLVLSGGGARGFAHIGVLKALRETGLPIDAVGGTSMGALIAAMAAMDMDYEAIIKTCRWIFVERGVFDYTLPLIALIAGRRARASLLTVFAERRIEDLHIKYFCVTTDLTVARTCMHHSGSLAEWASASILIPGVGPPHVHRGHLHCDGAVLDNLPVDFMHRFTPGRVVAVNVSPTQDLDLGHERVSASPWRLMLQKLKIVGPEVRFPGIVTILQRSAIVGSLRAAVEAGARASLLIEPALARFRLFEWHAIDKIVEEGYRAAKERLQGWHGA
jgi:predicted acylesterase/phospholipase RssA